MFKLQTLTSLIKLNCKNRPPQKISAGLTLLGGVAMAATFTLTQVDADDIIITTKQEFHSDYYLNNKSVESRPSWMEK